MIPTVVLKNSGKQFCLILLLFCSACTSIDSIKIDITAKPDIDDKKSAQIEQNLGESGYYYLLLNYKLINDDSLSDRLRRLGTRLTFYSERPELIYKYLVVDSKYSHAFSLPDGYIIFTKAMIDALKTDENIQAVIAHEMGHITARHGVYFYKDKYGAASSKAISGEKVISLAAQLGYHRAFELQSDLMAMRYLQRAGLKPESVIEVLGMLDGIQEKDDEVFKKDIEAGFGNKKALRKDPIRDLTYPDLANRIVHCRQKLDEVKKTEKVLYNPADFNMELK